MVASSSAESAESGGRGLRRGPKLLEHHSIKRLYALGFYVALLAWKFYNWAQLVEEDTESFWLFLKWIAIDCAFLFGLPELRIPWLELSQPFVVAAFFVHAVFDWLLMFNIGFPWQAWILGLVKIFYDRELAISEHNVKLSSIIHNSSLIMGRQIINILPEGSAVLNPDLHPFCLGGDRKTAPIPIFFNATIPVEVELIRTDLETNQQESIKLTRVQIRDIERKAKRESQEGVQTVVQFDYPAKKPGAYRLGRVLDEYKLEVQRKNPQTFVVPCPKAWVGPPASPGRCLGDLSDLTLQAEGIPPLKIKYSRTINGKDHSFHFQSLQPEGFVSPLGTLRSTSLIGLDDEDISWARSQRVPVGLNESMHASGDWQYSVDEVQDGFGNLVKYDSPADDPEGRPKPKHLVQNFVVKERPQVRLEGCDLRNPLKVAKGNEKELPVRFGIAGQTPDVTAHSLTWQFSPIDTLTESGDHGDVVSIGSYNAKNARDRPRISAPGLYTLKSVSASSCEGEVQEPSSCLLLNPLEPKLTIRSEEIPDTCAGNSIGLRVDMDLIGTPPFIVRYDVISNGQRRSERVSIPGLRYQMDLVPRIAGHHKYIFTHVGDDIYSGQKLTGSEYVLEQDVKPAAAALIQHSTGKMSSCLGDEVTVDILLLGEPPFTLEWEIIHDGKRKLHKATDIQSNSYQIKTAPLTQGGEYTLGLTSVQDTRGCRNFVQDELKISVRRQSPRAAFGQIEGKRKVLAVEGSTVKLPILERTVRNDNGYLDVKGRGTYTITDVWDSQCHGVVDPKASRFDVDWFPRPEMSVVLSHGVSQADDGYVLEDVCEGDVSGFEVALKGTPPYTVEYEVRHHPLQGSSSLSKKKFDASLGKESIQADTAKAGLYTYKFTALEDNLYSSDRHFKPLVVKQKVNRKPSASFAKPGQTFKYCKSEQDNEDGIPVTLTGVPPFSLEVEIKHQSAAVPEIYRTPTINSHSYEIRIPRHQLRLGTQQIRIRDVKDGSGCHSMAELGGPSVQVQLFEAPTIYPLETRTDYCVGERISYTLSGTPPFEVWYTFDGTERKAKSPTTSFRRVAESPGEFTITSLADRASECRAPVHITKTIHPMPAVRISKGKNVRVDIHEGGEVEILFEFWGTPPFEFTYTRSTNARKGQRSQVLETRHDVSHEHSKIIRANQEGTYEVVAIKDKYCAFSTQGAEAGKKDAGGKAQKVIKYH
ncbi:03f92610-e006-40c8-a778-cec5b561b5ff [Thermothielavioides terrestris]|uniref:03f92610-e006-40c8-a778-cec5b561b5ff n=1 Tax=Thermothielavioides terrestris TaxID=2587410 RepID=A0A446BTJ8_9PEZI|nr:03f92610-e006-40c8-a778-cec5b561b5ff [Thermothielavioides terrestris]